MRGQTGDEIELTGPVVRDQIPNRPMAILARDATFDSLDLTGCSFGASSLNRSHFVSCALSRVDFSESRFTDCAFRRCDLSGVNLADAFLNGESLQWRHGSGRNL